MNSRNRYYESGSGGEDNDHEVVEEDQDSIDIETQQVSVVAHEIYEDLIP